MTILQTEDLHIDIEAHILLSICITILIFDTTLCVMTIHCIRLREAAGCTWTHRGKRISSGREKQCICMMVVDTRMLHHATLLLSYVFLVVSMTIIGCILTLSCSATVNILILQ